MNILYVFNYDLYYITISYDGPKSSKQRERAGICDESFGACRVRRAFRQASQRMAAFHRRLARRTAVDEGTWNLEPGTLEIARRTREVH